MTYRPKAKNWEEAPEAVKSMYMERAMDKMAKFKAAGMTDEQAEVAWKEFIRKRKHDRTI